MAKASRIPRPKADRPAVVRHDEDTIIDIKVLDLKGKTVSEISKATGVPTTSILRFLNQHKPDPRQSETARKKQIAQHERLLGIAVQRLADESNGTGKGNANGSRASTKKESAPLPAAKRVATTGSTSRASPYANKASSLPTRPTRPAASTSQPTASSSKTAARESTIQSRYVAEKQKEMSIPSGSKSRGSPYVKPAKPESKPASKAEPSSSTSRRRSVPVVEVCITKGPRSSISKRTSTGPFSSEAISTASPARPLASGSRGVIMPKSSPAVVAPHAASTHRRTPSATPLPIPEGLVETLPPVAASPKSKGKQKAVSPEPEEDAEDEDEVGAEVEVEDEADSEGGEELDEDAEVDQEMEPELVESITTEVDLISQSVVDEALAIAEKPAVTPEDDDTAYPSTPIEIESSNAIVAEREGDLEDIDMAEPAPEISDDTSAADSVQKEATLVEETTIDDTLGDLEDEEDGGQVAASAMPVEETPVEDDTKASLLEGNTPIEEEVVLEEEIVEQTTVEEPSAQQPTDDTDMNIAESTEMTEDYVADISAAMEEAVHDLEAASGVEVDVSGSELAQLGAEVPNLEVEVEQQVKIVVEETTAESVPMLEEQGEKSEEPRTVEGSGEREVEITGDLEMDDAEDTQDDKVDTVNGGADLSTAPVDHDIASTTVKWPVAYPLNIGQEHISAASSLPEPYSQLFGRRIWPVRPTA